MIDHESYSSRFYGRHHLGDSHVSRPAFPASAKTTLMRNHVAGIFTQPKEATFLYRETIPSIPGILMFTVVSFTIAEIFSYCGLFHDESGLASRKEAKGWARNILRLSDDFETAMDEMLDGMDKWWFRNRFEKGGLLQWSTWRQKFRHVLELYSSKGLLGTLQWLSFKHQFAIGCTLGMMFQQVSWAATNTVFAIYFLTEILRNMKDIRDRDEEDDYDHPSSSSSSSSSSSIQHARRGLQQRQSQHMGKEHDYDTPHGSNGISMCLECLESVLSTVRQSMESMFQFLNATDEDFDNSLGTVIVGMGFGLLFKTVLF